MNRAAGLVVLCVTLACSESFPPASAVTDLRVIGARVDVEGDPGRANPNPGDAVQVSVLVTDQGAPPSAVPEVPALTPSLLQWALVPCIPAATLIGAPICSIPIEPCEGCIGAPVADPFGLPVIRFQVPARGELEEAQADTVLLQGVVCGNGQPSEDALLRFLAGETDDLSPCEGPPIIEGEPIEGRLVTVQIPIERDPDDPNLHPDILRVRLNGPAWPPPYDQGVPRTAPRSGCKADLDSLSDEERMAHPLAGSPPSNIDLSVTGGSLQSYTADGVDVTEEIQVSWLADSGSFEVSFSFITEPASSILTQWQPLSDAPESGRLVRFNFVVRDGRGGLDRFERGLCVLPPTTDSFPP